MSLCNAATGNERSLRRGRRRRVKGGEGEGGVGCGLWAARRSLLAVCWLSWGSLSCQLAMALAPGPKPLPQPTHLALPACLCLLSATSSTPALPEEHPRAHMSSLCGRCSGRWAPSKQQVFHQRQPTTIGSSTGLACVSEGVLMFQGAYHTPEVLGRALTHSLHHHHASLVVYSPVINTWRRGNAPNIHQQLNSS